MSHDYEKLANMLKMAAVFSDLMDDMTPRHNLHVGIPATPIVTNRQARADLENMARRKVEEFNRSLDMDDDAVCTDDTCKKCGGRCKEDSELDIEGYDSMSDFMKSVYDILFPDVAERIKKAKADASAKTEAVKTPDVHEPVGETYDDYEDDYEDDYDDEYIDDDYDDEEYFDDDTCDCGCTDDVEGEDSPICDGDCALCMAQRALEKADEIHSELDTIYEDIQGMRNEISEIKGMMAEILKKTSETPKTVETKAEDVETPKPKKPSGHRKPKAKAEEVKPKTAEDELKDKVAEVAKTKIPKKPRAKKTTE